MKRFLETIKLSVASKAFYQRVLEGREPMGFRYFFWLNMIYAVTIAAVFLPIVFAITSPKAHQEVIQTIPENLEVYVKKGMVSTNQPEPYVVVNTWSKDKSGEEVDKCKDEKCTRHKKSPTNLVVIDTQTPFSIEQFRLYDTAVLVKADSIITQKDNGTVEVVTNPKELDFTFNRAWVEKMINKFSWLAYLIPVGIFFLGSTFGYAFILLAYVIWALIAWALLSWYRKDIKVTFRHAYSVTLYASIVFFVLELLSYMLPFADTNTFQFIVFAIFLYVLTKKDTEVHEHIPGQPAKEVIADDDKNNGVV
ncbi:MAG: DUF1189 domain-containing protein [Candidatus Taylorbacteria bacterium]|nr:DUF1189 domain-containing protein [Candidatus Taylorbacteria bacterium]